MLKKNRFAAIVVAAGSGKRVGGAKPKQFMPLLDKPLLYYSLQAFERSPVEEIVLVTGLEDIAYCQREIIEKYALKKVSKIIAGGEERYHSVAAGLKALSTCDYVLIHDGARPCLDQEIIARCMKEVALSGACTAGVPVVDTICSADGQGLIQEIPDRNSLWSIQTPQAFSYEDIKKAHSLLAQKVGKKSIDTKCITDDVRVLRDMLKADVSLVEGSEDNLKVTTKGDILRAEQILRQRECK